MDEQAGEALAGDRRGAGIGGLQEGLAVIELESALVLAASVAFDAAGLEDGLDVLGEVDRACGRRREGVEFVLRQLGVEARGAKDRESSGQPQPGGGIR